MSTAARRRQLAKFVELNPSPSERLFRLAGNVTVRDGVEGDAWRGTATRVNLRAQIRANRRGPPHPNDSSTR